MEKAIDYILKSVGVFGFILAVINYFTTIKFKKKEEEKWLAINKPVLVFKDANMMKWETFKIKDVEKMDWGHKALLIKKSSTPDDVKIPYKPVAIDLITNQKINTNSLSFTVNDLLEKVKECNFDGELQIAKQYTANLTLENAGGFKAEHVNCNLFFSNDDNWELVTSKEKRIMAPKESTSIEFDIMLPLYKEASNLSFKLNVSYETAFSNLEKETFKFTWLFERDSWQDDLA